MQAVKGEGTSLEKRLWAMLAGMRLRGWKKNDRTLAGKPDVVFAKQQVALFIDGCFWHGCPHCQRKLPKTNRKYWKKKIERNIELAQIHDEQLRREGWTIVRIWEHEMQDKALIRARILCILKRKERQSEKHAS